MILIVIWTDTKGPTDECVEKEDSKDKLKALAHIELSLNVGIVNIAVFEEQRVRGGVLGRNRSVDVA